ncbi:Hypothetical protein SCF082_LOCUS808 [Durusdinium trenchii]|uniref:Uncharacterized protein n=1 Tax=Durusdinium trenchii TaxID=1381693 RepID=A0ABP0HA18_9DINO
MPKKKVPVKLPKVGASSSASYFASKSTELPESSIGEKSSRNPFEADFAELLASKDDWSIQAPEEIIEEAKRTVQGRKPWRGGTTDETLLQTKREPEDSADGGCHIILPDNRVVAVESQLSRRLVDELLGNVPPERAKSKEDELEFKVPSHGKHRRRQGDEVYLGESQKSPRKMRNPWYLPPKVWYSGEMGKDPNEDLGLGFPYDTYLGEVRPKRAQEEEPPTFEKDISAFLETTKKHFQAQGHRLPHCLQVAVGQMGHG